MHEFDKDKMITVMLKDTLDLALPRVQSIRIHLESGGVLTNSDLEFIHDELDKVTRFYRHFTEDDEATQIFSHFSHMLSEVVSLALKNEQEQS